VNIDRSSLDNDNTNLCLTVLTEFWRRKVVFNNNNKEFKLKPLK